MCSYQLFFFFVTSAAGKVDKYGRPITDPSKEDLSRLYTIEEEDEKAKTKKLQRKTVKSEEEASEEQVEKAEEAVKVEESERSESESDSAEKEDSEISEESSEESSKESLESEEDTGSSLIPKVPITSLSLSLNLSESGRNSNGRGNCSTGCSKSGLGSCKGTAPQSAVCSLQSAVCLESISSEAHSALNCYLPSSGG